MKFEWPSGLKRFKKPKEVRAFVFYIVAALCMWEFGRSLGRLFTTSYFQITSENDPFINFVITKNTGGAFGLLSNYTEALAFFGIAAIALITAFVYFKLNLKDRSLMIASVLTSAGILGNLFERLTQGYVIDYIKLNFVDFAIFNAFDIMICTGVVLFSYCIINEEITKRIKGNGKG